VIDASSLDRDTFTQKINQSLIINLLTHQGDPNLFVHCDLVPSTFGEYTWNSNGQGFETLFIGAHQFQKLDKQCN